MDEMEKPVFIKGITEEEDLKKVYTKGEAVGTTSFNGDELKYIIGACLKKDAKKYLRDFVIPNYKNKETLDQLIQYIYKHFPEHKENIDKYLILM